MNILGHKNHQLAQQAEAGKSASLSALTWQRFRRDPMAMVSLGVILLFVIIALLGYLITPDHTPHCNQQYLELATLKPGSTATFLCITPVDEEERPLPPAQRPNGVRRMLSGEPLPYTRIPIYQYRWAGNLLYAETYTGSSPNEGDTLCYPRSQVVDIQTQRFLLGTDGYGRDVLSQIMIGSRVSLSVGFIAIVIALVIGITLGALAAYYGRWVDNLITWLINVVWSIPTVLLVIAITFALGKGFWQVFIAVGLTMWVDIARVVRGQVFSIKEKEYIEAARALGYTTPRIILRHILPNILGPIIVVTASNFASAILLEAGLSFLGIGVQPPMPSWGSMVKENYPYILLDSAYLAFLPGLAIMIIVLAFMLLGNGVRNALDTKTQ